jgi:riboflavin synthase alpha subunit
MRHTIHKVEEIKWFNEKTNNIEVWYTVDVVSIDGYIVSGHFDTEYEAEEYLIQQINIKRELIRQQKEYLNKIAEHFET